MNINAVAGIKVINPILVMDVFSINWACEGDSEAMASQRTEKNMGCVANRQSLLYICSPFKHFQS